MEKSGSHKQFSSLEEEVAYLREKVIAQEKERGETEAEQLPKHIIHKEIKAYAQEPSESALHPSYQSSSQETQAIVLRLSPKETDAQIEVLLGVLQEKGIHNSLKIVEGLGNPALEDDFHRFLVEYVAQGFSLRGLTAKSELAKSLHMTLYEVAIQEQGEEKNTTPRPFKEIVSSMEQFYAGMLSITDKKSRNTFSLELAVPNHTQEVVFYAAVPSEKKDLFEKQFLSIFPKSRLRLLPDDYSIFSDDGVVAFSHATLESRAIFPLKFYEEFDFDPLQVIVSSFSKIARDGEGAALQLIIDPEDRGYIKKYQQALEDIKNGISVKEATLIPESLAGDLGKGVFGLVKDVAKGFINNEEEEKDKKGPSPKDEVAVENIKQKMKSPVVKAVLRIAVSASDATRAQAILKEITSGFNQFAAPQSNRLKFVDVPKRALKEEEYNFIFRLFDDEKALPLSIKELTTIFHFPGTGPQFAPELRQAESQSAPAPMEQAHDGILLGVNRYHGAETKVILGNEDRLRHLYVIGQTGTGKSALLKNMVVQDIQRGEGVCMIDPHGTDIIDILASVPKERYRDVIYFDPSYTPRPMAFNMLEYDENFPEQKTFIVNELISIFNKLFDMKTAGGPMFEQYFRNSALLVMDHPASGNTLIEVGRVLGDKEFRDLKLSHCKNPIIKEFWANAEKTTGEQGLANFVPYVTSKFDAFLSDEIMRPLVAQEHSSINFRDIMDNKKIFLVNLSKGRLGEINANLLGLIIIGKLFMAALSRVDSISKNLPPFFLYIDEFQNITTDSIAGILSEARKYKLSLNIAHQYIAQLEEKIRDAVFGNVGSIAAFRVGAPDAEFLEKQFAPTFTQKDIMNIENWNAYVKMLVSGKPEKPFNIATLPPSKGDTSIVDGLRELSYLTYGKDREEVEAEIFSRYKKVRG